MVSVKDIAAKCGVSTATVSKALNDHKDVGEATKIRIRKAAEEMGYYPNAAARALKTKHSYNLGVLLDDRAHSGLTHEYFSQVLEGMKVEAESRGYDLTFLNTHNKKMTYYEHCRSRNLDGVLITCETFESPEIQQLMKSRIPTVTIDYVFNTCTSVESNNVKGMRELTRYACSLGHKKIAYIHGEEGSKVTTERVAAFYQTMEEEGNPVPNEYVRESAYLQTQQAEEVTKELLQLPDPPTCIFYPDDLAAMGGLNAAKELKRKVPQDLSVAGYDGSLFSQMLHPKLTTIRQNSREIGKNAAKELIAVIENPKTALIKRIVIDGVLLPGETIRRISNSK